MNMKLPQGAQRRESSVKSELQVAPLSLITDAGSLKKALEAGHTVVAIEHGGLDAGTETFGKEKRNQRYGFRSEPIKWQDDKGNTLTAYTKGPYVNDNEMASPKA